MPIFRTESKLIYYAHVPKAGGTSVADFLRAKSRGTAFIFSEQWKQRPRDRWSSTSPQHIFADKLAELFPCSFFDYAFAVVRHPEERILSEYRFRVERSRLHAAMPFSDWLRVVVSASQANRYVFDGHIRPQVEFIPPRCEIFKLEDGLADLAQRVAEVIGSEASGITFDQHSNRSQHQEIVLRRRDRALIQEFYRADFERFGYEPHTEPPLSQGNPLSSLRARALGAASSLITHLLSTRIPY